MIQHLVCCFGPAVDSHWLRTMLIGDFAALLCSQHWDLLGRPRLGGLLEITQQVALLQNIAVGRPWLAVGTE